MQSIQYRFIIWKQQNGSCALYSGRYKTELIDGMNIQEWWVRENVMAPTVAIEWAR